MEDKEEVMEAEQVCSRDNAGGTSAACIAFLCTSFRMLQSFGRRDQCLLFGIDGARPGAYYRVGACARNAVGVSAVVWYKDVVRVQGAHLLRNTVNVVTLNTTYRCIDCKTAREVVVIGCASEYRS
jgi:hypothetical protein